ncbi:5'/3'-nucleotidase SurE [Aneurinibacillus sp. Ricciae_BoGa-3]|uniref:5'/3'-nucleotidase SurE n=1 Tax=Aneurinibacillus sp. Ricciae_BoGa-3 TaxID=3022697 RepID=UPI0023425602|nr:5'/3'-nucleotidase SurE [Aneurinibacillus sp. Ricciae_BoGa-3]WCK55929.1 5'/3'-nucleotidase SurE [Aneurinibacillus sp. Ricciae_BoGa-3]
MYTIVITNDDGIEAQGIHRLAISLAGLAKVVVVAPDQERSAEGHRITVREGLTVRQVDFHGTGLDAWAVNGTPADCIKMAVNVILAEKPDLVISGINAGLNMGKDIYYSGTVSAAREAVINGVPAIAVSYDNYLYPGDFGEVEKLLRPIWEEISIHSIPLDVLLNVNVPHLRINKLKGTAITGLDIHHYQDRIKEKQGKAGAEFWLEREYGEAQGVLNDYSMVKDGFISVTPIHIDSTDREFMKEMKSWHLFRK